MPALPRRAREADRCVLRQLTRRRPPATAPTADRVAVTITGGVNYVLNAELDSGDVVIVADGYGWVALGGGGTAGTAQVHFNVRRWWILPVYFGTVTVDDSAASLHVSLPVFFGRGYWYPEEPMASGTSAYWITSSWPWKSGAFAFAGHDYV